MNKKTYGLIGKNIAYSFSKQYFTEKFKTLQLENYEYHLFDIENIENIQSIIERHQLQGFNVTIPYKESIIPYLDEISAETQKIAAVNTVLVFENKLIGYNTDYYGFLKSIKPHLKSHHQKALILGNGGASKAVQEALFQLNIPFSMVTRNGLLNYQNLSEEIIIRHPLIIQTTPVGTFPNHETVPFPFQYLTDQHLVYDLIYNPTKTKFLEEAEKQNATIINGITMLHFQAEKAWEIWNSKP